MSDLLSVVERASESNTPLAEDYLSRSDFSAQPVDLNRASAGSH
jgi:hypothetical protein